MSRIVSEDVSNILKADLPWEKFSGKTVLVTGAGGLLPAYMAITLLHLNSRLSAPCTVVAVVRDPVRAAMRLGAYLDRPDLRLIEADMSRPFSYDGPADFVIHAASPASPAAYMQDPVGTMLVNVVGAQSALDISVRRGAQSVLMFSSGEVYGETGDVLVHEKAFGHLDPATVRACYGEGKRAAETLSVAYAFQHGAPVKIVRPMHTYGPMMDLNDGRVFSDFVADILARRNIQMKSDGLAKRPFCYLADATVGYFTVLFKGENAKPYNVGNDLAVLNIRDLASTLVREAFPELGLLVEIPPSAPAAQSPITGGRPDVSRLRALGWAPTIGVVEGFRRTVRSFVDIDATLGADTESDSSFPYDPSH